MIFEWTEGSRFSVPAQTAGEELERIRRRHKGELEPAVVVKESRSRKSPLHACFEWDDVRAAQMHREEQARLLIRSVRVVEEAAEPQRAYVNVKTTKGSRYVPISTAMANVLMRRQVLKDAKILLNGVRQRLSSLKKIKGIITAVDILEGEIEREIEKAERARPKRKAVPAKKSDTRNAAAASATI
jgi:hypothetical protein